MMDDDIVDSRLGKSLVESMLNPFAECSLHFMDIDYTISRRHAVTGTWQCGPCICHIYLTCV